MARHHQLSTDIHPAEHPYYQQCYLRLLPVVGGRPKVIAYLYGGQGNINVPFLVAGQPPHCVCEQYRHGGMTHCAEGLGFLQLQSIHHPAPWF